MNAEELTRRGFERVKNTELTATKVAGELLSEQWALLPEETKIALAVCGLAKIINDEMAEDRMRQVSKEYTAQDAQIESRAAEARAERDGRMAQRRAMGQKAFCAEARRIHEAIGGCKRRTCQTTFDCLLSCIGGEDVVLLPEAEKQVFIAERIREREEYSDHVKTVEGIHVQLRCTKITCGRDGASGYAARENCVKWILRTPEAEREEEIKKWREMNELHIRENRENMERMGKMLMDFGYEAAVADLESIMLIACDGMMKPLLSFRRTDLDSWRQRGESNAIAWQERVAWFALAREALERHDVDCIRELPPPEVQKLAASARLVWKNNAVDESGGGRQHRHRARMTHV